MSLWTIKMTANEMWFRSAVEIRPAPMITSMITIDNYNRKKNIVQGERKKDKTPSHRRTRLNEVISEMISQMNF